MYGPIFRGLDFAYGGTDSERLESDPASEPFQDFVPLFPTHVYPTPTLKICI